jgi:predicted phage terminase large subunit-like protein
MREQLGTTSFMAQYQQVTQDAQGGIIKKSWIKELISENKPCTYFIDSAYGGSNADFNAIIGAYKEGNNLIIQMCEINKYEFPELIKWLLKNIPVNSKIYIEGKASGKSIIQTLKKETSFNIIEIQPKGSKLERKNAVSPYFEAGRIILNQYINYKNEIIEQIIYDNAKHDDIMDVITYAIEYLLKVNKGQYNII